MTSESITWTLIADEYPDADTAVLIYAPSLDEPVWFGSWDGEHWWTVEGMDLGMQNHPIIAWANMPAGPSR